MPKTDYDQLAQQMIPLLGGRENIGSVKHCMTRLRFNVKNKDAVQADEVAGLDVLKCVWVGDQFQVVIGTTVDQAYEAICRIGNFETSAAVDEAPDAADTKPEGKKTPKELFSSLLATLSECLVPLLPLLLAMGMFASVVAIFGPTVLGVMPPESAAYRFFSLAQNSITYFLPLMAAYTAAVKFGCNPLYSMMACAFLFYPDTLAAIDEGTFSFGPLSPSGSTPQILASILMTWCCSKVEKPISNMLPSSLRACFSGFLTLLVIIPLFMFVIAPLGDLFGAAIAGAMASLAAVAPWLVPAIAGLLWVPLIIPGMHLAVAMVFLPQLLETGVDHGVVMAVMCVCMMGAATDLGIIFRNKDAKERQVAIDSLIAVILGGVIEPSLYGLYLEKPRRLAACCLGLGVSGLLMGLLGVGYYGYGPNNFMFFTSYLAGGVPNFLKAMACIACGMTVAFAVTATEKKSA